MRTGAEILLIDDEAVVQASCARILEDTGARLTIAPRGDAGLELLAARTFDAVLLDLKMPGMDGAEVLARIRQRWPDLPVVVITGYATMETERSCLAAGASAWLAKPFDPDVFCRILEDVMAGEDQEG